MQVKLILIWFECEMLVNNFGLLWLAHTKLNTTIHQIHDDDGNQYIPKDKVKHCGKLNEIHPTHITCSFFFASFFLRWCFSVLVAFAQWCWFMHLFLFCRKLLTSNGVLLLLPFKWKQFYFGVVYKTWKRFWTFSRIQLVSVCVYVSVGWVNLSLSLILSRFLPLSLFLSVCAYCDWNRISWARIN